MSKIRRVLLYLFLLLSPLAFCKWTYDYTIFKLILPQIFFLLIALTFLLEKREFQYHKPLTILLSFYLLVNIFSLLVNPFHHVSYPYMLKLLTYFSIFLLTVNLGKDERIFFFLFASGALASFWAISDFYKFGLVNAGFGNKNFFAGYIIFLVPLSLSFIFIHPHHSSPVKGEGFRTFYPSHKWGGRKGGGIIFFCLFLLYSFALFLTKSQAAYLAVIIAILFLFVSYSKNRKMVLIKIFSILFFVFLISFSRVNSPSAGTATTSRASSTTTTTNFYFVDQITGNVRFLVWRGTINMAKVNPFTGWGPGTFSLRYPNYRVTEYYLQKAIAPITAHSHCEYLEILAETGIFGFFLFILFILFIFREGLKIIHPPPPYPSPSGGEGKKGGGKIGWGGRLIIIGLLAGIIALLIDNLLSTNLRQSFTPILLFFAMGLVISYSKKRIRDPSLRAQGDTWQFSSHASVVIFSLLILFLTFAAFNTFKRDVFAGFYLKKALNARLKKDFPRAILHYKKTISVDHFNLIAYYKLAFAYGTLKKYDLALSTYKKLYPLSPHYAQIDKNMGVLYYEKGNLDASLYYFRQAEKLNPYDVNTLGFITSIFLIRKEFPRARFYLKRILLLDSTNFHALACLKEIGRNDIMNK